MSKNIFVLQERVRRYQQHKRRIILVPPTIDNKAPKVLRHFNSKSKPTAWKTEKLTRIQKDNRILMKKLRGILNRPSDIIPKDKPDRRKKSLRYRGLNGKKKREDRLKVSRENVRFAERLMTVRPTYSRRSLLNQSHQHVQYRRRLSNPLLTPDMSKIIDPCDYYSHWKPPRSFPKRLPASIDSLVKTKLQKGWEFNEDLVNNTKTTKTTDKKNQLPAEEVKTEPSTEYAIPSTASETRVTRSEGYLGGKKIVLQERKKNLRRNGAGKVQRNGYKRRETKVPRSVVKEGNGPGEERLGSRHPLGGHEASLEDSVCTDTAVLSDPCDTLDLSKLACEERFGCTDSLTTISHPNSLARKDSTVNLQVTVTGKESDERTPGDVPLSVSLSLTKLDSNVHFITDVGLVQDAKTPGHTEKSESELPAVAPSLTQKVTNPTKIKTASNPRQNLSLISDARLLYTLIREQGNNFPGRALVRTLVRRNPADRQQISREYQRLYGKNMAKELKRVLGQHWTVFIDTTFLVPNDVAQKDQETSDPDVMARKLHSWAKTHPQDFIRNLVLASDRNMNEVRKAFLEKFHIDLPTFVDLRFKHPAADVLVEVAKKKSRTATVESSSRRSTLLKEIRQQETGKWLHRDWWRSHQGAGSDTDSRPKSFKTSSKSRSTRMIEVPSRPKREQQPQQQPQQQLQQQPQQLLPWRLQRGREKQRLSVQKQLQQQKQQQRQQLLQQQRQQRQRQMQQQRQQQQLLQQLQRQQQQLRRQQQRPRQLRRRDKRQLPLPEQQQHELLQQKQKQQQQQQQQKLQDQKSKTRGRAKTRNIKTAVVSYYLKPPVDDDMLAIANVAEWNKHTPRPCSAEPPRRQRNKKRGTLTASNLADVVNIYNEGATSGKEMVADVVTVTGERSPERSGDLVEATTESPDLDKKTPMQDFEQPVEEPEDSQLWPEESSTEMEQAQIFRRRRYPARPLLEEPADSTESKEVLEEHDLPAPDIRSEVLGERQDSSPLDLDTSAATDAQETQAEEKRQESLRYRQRLEKALKFWSRAEEESKIKRFEKLSRRRCPKPEWVSETTIKKEKSEKLCLALERTHSAEDAEAQNSRRTRKFPESTAKRISHTNEPQPKVAALAVPAPLKSVVHDNDVTSLQGARSSDKLEKTAARLGKCSLPTRLGSAMSAPSCVTTTLQRKSGDQKREGGTQVSAKLRSGRKPEKVHPTKTGNRTRTATNPASRRCSMPKEYEERVKNILTCQGKQHNKSTFALISNMFYNSEYGLKAKLSPYNPFQSGHFRPYIGSGGPQGRHVGKGAPQDRMSQISQAYGEDRCDGVKVKKTTCK